MPTVLECVDGPPKGKRIELAKGKPTSFKIRRHDRDAGQVVVELIDEQCVITNRSELPCLVNGEARPRSVLRNGDQVVIGKNTFRVKIDEADAGATQQLDKLVLEDAGPPQVCSVCDAVFVAQQGWTDGEHRICRRCLVKGVRPEHLPRPQTPPGGAMVNPDGETKVASRFDSGQRAAPRPDSGQRAAPRDDSGQHAAQRDDSGQHAVPPRSDSGERPASSSSDGHKAQDRHAKRISASRLSAVEPDPHEKPAGGLLKRVSSMLGGGRADRARLEQLEHERQVLLVEAGRLSLGAGGGLGIADEALLPLLSGRPITLDPEKHLSWSVLDQWRSQRERLLVLDTEIAALRKALGLGPDPEATLRPAPALRPEMKEKIERAFHTLDGLATEDLGRTAEDVLDLPATTPTQPAPAPVSKSNSSGGRRTPTHRRRR
jgi:hypothetical protein